MIKCLVWDLDETLWEGVLSEGDPARPRAQAEAALRVLDERGILHSIASKNDNALVLSHLRSHGLDDYFVYPQIGWSAKSVAIARIAEQLQLAPGNIAFVDDCPVERAEVASVHPQVLCLDVTQLGEVASMEAFSPRSRSPEAGRRRELVQLEIRRQQAEQEHQRPSLEFLAELELELDIFEAGPEHLSRAEELTARTTQLNSTGLVYRGEDLQQLMEAGVRCWLMRACDRFGDYGTVALALVDERPPQHRCRLLLTSCRVLNRGVGIGLLTYLMRRAQGAGLSLQVDYQANTRNRMMDISLRLAGFSRNQGGFGWSGLEAPSYPEYFKAINAPRADDEPARD
ncbi:MAG: HAD-IIIC family phosphatase [Vulcanimicrobiota bacterium]